MDFPFLSEVNRRNTILAISPMIRILILEYFRFHPVSESEMAPEIRITICYGIYGVGQIHRDISVSTTSLEVNL